VQEKLKRGGEASWRERIALKQNVRVEPASHMEGAGGTEQGCCRARVRPFRASITKRTGNNRKNSRMQLRRIA